MEEIMPSEAEVELIGDQLGQVFPSMRSKEDCLEKIKFVKKFWISDLVYPEKKFLPFRKKSPGKRRFVMWQTKYFKG